MVYFTKPNRSKARFPLSLKTSYGSTTSLTDTGSTTRPKYGPLFGVSFSQAMKSTMMGLLCAGMANISSCFVSSPGPSAKWSTAVTLGQSSCGQAGHQLKMIPRSPTAARGNAAISALTALFSRSSSNTRSGNDGGDDIFVTRAGFGKTAAGAALAALLAGPTVANGAGAKRTVVLTGANSGIGLDAATKLVALGHDVHVVCRTERKARAAAEESGAAGSFACDLSSLESVRSFVNAWGSKPIDSLCLNAGMAPNTKGSPAYTKEGFEEAVGTNHLGHFLMANLLIKPLESGSSGQPRLVVTASSVHDPDTPGGNVGSKATLGNLIGLERYLSSESSSKTFDMVDGEVYDGDKAYKDSKLCNVFFTREAQRRLTAKGSKVKVDCFSPGLVSSSGLFRNQNPIFSKIFDFAATYVLKVAATVGQGGDTLVEMVTIKSLEDDVGGRFLATTPGKPDSAFAPQAVSVEAQDMAKGQRLWELSAGCVGLGAKTPI